MKKVFCILLMAAILVATVVTFILLIADLPRYSVIWHDGPIAAYAFAVVFVAATGGFACMLIRVE